MTKALIVMSAALVCACGSAATPVPQAHEAAAKAPEPARQQARATSSEPHRAPTAPFAPESADDTDRRVIAELERAYDLYQAFISRAGDDPTYAEAVARSKERMADIGDTLDFMRQGLKERR